MTDCIKKYLAEQGLEIDDIKHTAWKTIREELASLLLEKSNLSRRGIVAAPCLNCEMVEKDCSVKGSITCPYDTQEKAGYAFVARRKAIQRTGLLQVRGYRLNFLAREEGTFQEQLDQKAQVYPEMAPLMILRVMSKVSIINLDNSISELYN